MGKTQSIEDKEKANKEFQDFMKEVETEAHEEETKIHGRVLELITTHYDANKWSHARLFGDRRSDYQNYDDWSLDRVTAIIQSIGDALTDKAYPSSEVPGSEDADKSAIDTAKEFAGAFAGDYDLIIKRVVGLLSAVLSQLGSRSSATRTEVLRDTPLSGGLHLFFGCSGKMYEKTSFFAHQFIGSFQVIFEAHVSAEEARTIALQQILKTTEVELDLLNKLIIEIRTEQAKELSKLLKDPEKWRSTKATFDEMLASVKESRQDVVATYEKYKGVVDAVDATMDILDLTAHGRPAPSGGAIPLDHFFRDDWEYQLAQRYIAEKLAS